MKLLFLFFIFFNISSCSTNDYAYIPQRDYALCYSVNDCAKVIRNAIQDNWSRPESARNGMVAWLDISLSNDGNLISVKISKTSGNDEFDLSTLKAVEKASPFTELSGLGADKFINNFERFRLVFRPEDLSR